MKPFSPFDHRQDRDLGTALRRVLTPENHRAFVERVVERARRQIVEARYQSSWDVLGSWSRPGMVAAVAMTLLAVWGVSGVQRAEPDPITIDDEVAQTSEEASFLLSQDPPDADVVLTAFFEN